jgi:hypothetical protein
MYKVRFFEKGSTSKSGFLDQFTFSTTQFAYEKVGLAML